ncbi:hypothetical protein [uncultured Arcticibacterium sp.]|uniref:hypothetical protein n=1 Tax=uncultured Arcticibacterium sp. TaxID=2173042 RepID=UPI0030F65165
MKKLLLLLLLPIAFFSCADSKKSTKVSITGNQFLINDELTYKGREWEGQKIEGLLFNSRMVQGIFDDTNPETQDNFVYPDTKTWDADRNTNEFIAAMSDWKAHGLSAFTLNLQGGSPLGYGNKGWINTTFDSKGELKADYMARLERILNKADELNMVVILGYFYFGQDQFLDDEAAVINAVDNITKWILEHGYTNILVELNNESNIQYDHEILKVARVHELIKRVQDTEINGNRLLVSTSFGGGTVPSQKVADVSDFILIHGNGVKTQTKMLSFIERVKDVVKTPKPIVINEDDHFNFESDTCNFVTATKQYVSWGYFDFRMKDEGFENGFQSVPVDWAISSERKKSFFNKMKEITQE